MITGTSSIPGIGGYFREDIPDLRNMRRKDIGLFARRHKLDFDMTVGKSQLDEKIRELYHAGKLSKNALTDLAGFVRKD